MDEKARERRLEEFRADVAIGVATIDADMAYMLSQDFVARAGKIKELAESAWADARRGALEAFRACVAEHGRRDADSELGRRYERRWEAAKAAYAAVLAARRALAAARELAPAAEVAYWHARDCAERDAAGEEAAGEEAA